MGATLDALYKLQQIDQRLRSTREKIESKTRQVNAAQKRAATLQRQIEDTELRLRQAQSEADRLDLERQGHEDHIAKLREALNTARTNKEYAAILTELNTDKADATKMEEEALEALTRADTIKADQDRLKAELEKANTRVQDSQEAADKLQSKYADKLQRLENDREEAASALMPDVRDTFNRAADQNDGDAMAIVEKTHPKRAEYICGGCYMGITLETINSLQTSDRIQQCQTCLRILYLEEPANATA